MDSSLLGGELRKWARSTFFYRTSRDAMRNRGLCCRAVSVRPSVHLSVTLVYCIHTTEDIVKLLSRPGSPITLVFDAQCQYPLQFQGKPLQRGRKINGGGKILRFSTEVVVYLGNGTR